MKNSILFHTAVSFFCLVFINAKAQTTTKVLSNTVGDVSYESKDHRSNVYQVVSDRKVIDNNQFQGVIIAATDYYPYGSEMGIRSFSDKTHKYGFQGQGKDNEVKGNGNSINYKYRMHDARVGRFFAVDPLGSKYPYYSSYQFSGNKTIAYVELEGLEEKDKIKGNSRLIGKVNADVIRNDNGEVESIIYDVGYLKEFTITATLTEREVELAYVKKFGESKDDELLYSGDWIFGADLSGKLKIGIGIGGKANIGGVGHIGGELNLVTAELLSGNVGYNYGERGFNYGGSYIGKDGVAISQGVGVNAGVFGYDILGINYEHNFRGHDGYATDETHSFDLSIIVPIVQKDWIMQDYGSEMGGTIIPKRPEFKPSFNFSSDFRGLDLGVGAQIFIGAEVNLKIGYSKIIEYKPKLNLMRKAVTN